MLSTNSLTLLSGCAVTLLQASIPCYFGSQIKFNSQQFMASIEYGEWIKSNDKKNFIFLQENLKHVIMIRAGRLFDIDLNSFLAIIRAAYTFYTFLK